jgi:hypothetical protein
MFILMILYDLCLLRAQFHVQIADRRASWKISNGAEKFVLRALKF